MIQPKWLHEANSTSRNRLAGWTWAILLASGLFMCGCQSLTGDAFILSDTETMTKGVPGEVLQASNLVVDQTGQPVQLEVSDQTEDQLPPSELNKFSLPRYRIEPPTDGNGGTQ